MKKLLIAIFVLALFSGLAYAGDGELGDEALTNNVYCIVNTNATNALQTLIPLTDLIPAKCRITRFEVSPLGPSGAGASIGEATASFNDCSTASRAIDKTVECEIESDGENSTAKVYERPYRVINGCVVTQGPRTVVTVEWEQITP